MSDVFTAEPTPDAGPLVARVRQRNRCSHCGRPFGLVRQRLAGKQLCSKPCLTAESDRMQRVLKDKVRRLAHLPGSG